MFTLAYQQPGKAQGKVADVYAHFDQRGVVPAPLQLLSASPDLLELQFNQIKYFMKHPKLSFALLSAIRFLASQQICYEHCQVLNREWLVKSGLTEADLTQLANGENVDAFSDEENALLQVVARVLRKEKVNAENVAQLNGLGWSDSDILDACTQGSALIGVSYLFEAFSK